VTTKGERRAWRRFLRTTRQCRAGKPRALKAAALTAAERARVEIFEARLMLELTLDAEGVRNGR
jgi:hypothetical protein